MTIPLQFASLYDGQEVFDGPIACWILARTSSLELLSESEGFNSIAAIFLFIPELINSQFVCRPLAPRLLISEAVKRLLENKMIEANVYRGQNLSTQEDLLDMWKSCRPPRSSVPDAVKTGRTKLRDIPTYVSSHTPSATPLSRELNLVDDDLCSTERKNP